mmetsp:Transcript_4385/g.13004  ORF Transcript_4385/g.13004 Transcript_4385/m.13004 type:complete len:508 (-) Transcript_4385:124-1647(-)
MSASSAAASSTPRHPASSSAHSQQRVRQLEAAKSELEAENQRLRAERDEAHRERDKLQAELDRMRSGGSSGSGGGGEAGVGNCGVAHNGGTAPASAAASSTDVAASAGGCGSGGPSADNFGWGLDDYTVGDVQALMAAGAPEAADEGNAEEEEEEDPGDVGPRFTVQEEEELAAGLQLGGWSSGRQRKAPDRLTATNDPRARPPWVRKMLERQKQQKLLPEGEEGEAAGAAEPPAPLPQTYNAHLRASVDDIQPGARVRVWWTAAMLKDPSAAGCFERGEVRRVEPPELARRGGGLTVRFEVYYPHDDRTFPHKLEEDHVEIESLAPPAAPGLLVPHLHSDSADSQPYFAASRKRRMAAAATASALTSSVMGGAAASSSAFSPRSALRGEQGDVERGQAVRRSTMRHDALSALRALSGGGTRHRLVERDTVVQHAYEHGEAQTRGDDNLRLYRDDMVTVLGKEKHSSCPLWSQEESSYALTQAGWAVALEGDEGGEEGVHRKRKRQA